MANTCVSHVLLSASSHPKGPTYRSMEYVWLLRLDQNPGLFGRVVTCVLGPSVLLN